MTEPYSKLTNIQPLSQQTLESLERFQQQMTNAIEPYKKIANMLFPFIFILEKGILLQIFAIKNRISNKNSCIIASTFAIGKIK